MGWETRKITRNTLIADFEDGGLNMIHLQQFNAYLITTVQCLSQNKLDKKILFQFERWRAKNHGKEYKILWG